MHASPVLSSIADPTPAVTPQARPIRPALKPKDQRRPTFAPLATGRVAQRLARAQGHAFTDIRADMLAADANDTADQIDRYRDADIRQALRLVKLARRDRSNADAYLALAEGHLCEAIRRDQLHDEHRQRGRAHIDQSIAAARAVVGVHEELLSVRRDEAEGVAR